MFVVLHPFRPIDVAAFSVGLFWAYSTVAVAALDCLDVSGCDNSMDVYRSDLNISRRLLLLLSLLVINLNLLLMLSFC